MAIFLVATVSLSCADSVPVHATDSGRPGSTTERDLVLTPEAATAAWYAGDHDTATEIYRRLVARDPDRQEYRLSLVILLREEGRIEEAIRYSADLPGRYAVEHEMNLALAGVPLNAPDMSEVPEIPGQSGDRTVSSVSRLHFWQGVRAVLAADYRPAADHFNRAIETAEYEHFPYAYYALGRLAAGRGDYNGAVAAYRSALEQDRNLTEVFVPLAQALWEQGEYRAAWDRMERARIALPWNDAIPTILAAWEAEQPSLTAGGEERAQARRVAATPPRVAAGNGEYREGEVLRVGLVENLDSVYLKTGGPFVLSVGETVVYESGDGVGATVLRATIGNGGDDRSAPGDGEITVTVEGGEPLYRGTDAVLLGYRDRTRTTTIFDMTYGHGQFFSGREDRSYRGEIEILPIGDLFTVVNRLSVEEYLYSVVPSEMPAWWPAAALEAQAIAARSYTLHPRNRFAERGFDLLSSVTSASYPGVTNEHPRTTAAVDATRGRVLRDGGRPLDAVYSANHAGYGEAAGSVWGWPNSLVSTSDPLLPELDTRRSPAEVYRWLVSRPDSYSGRPPYAGRSSYRWELLVPRESIEQRLADAGQSVGTVERIVPGPRGITGRVEAVTIHGSAGTTEVRRDAIRSRLGGLRSNLFVVSAYTGPNLADDGTPPAPGRGGDRDGGGTATAVIDRAAASGSASETPRYFYFQGAGWGHGVGLDQTGAAGMAEAGFDAATILNHYYPRNEVVTWY